MSDRLYGFRFSTRPSSVGREVQDTNQELFEYSDPAGSAPYVRARSGFGFCLPTRSSAPTHAGHKGEAWLIEDSDVVYVYNGTGWRTLILASP